MYLIYHPEGDEAEQVFEFKANKLMTVERELLEKHTGRTYEEACQRIIQGGSVERRALLWIFLKRENTRLRYQDVDFTWDELKLEFSKEEWADMRKGAEDALVGDDLTNALVQIDKEMETARSEGKA